MATSTDEDLFPTCFPSGLHLPCSYAYPLPGRGEVEYGSTLSWVHVHQQRRPRRTMQNQMLTSRLSSPQSPSYMHYHQFTFHRSSLSPQRYSHPVTITLNDNSPSLRDIPGSTVRYRDIFSLISSPRYSTSTSMTTFVVEHDLIRARRASYIGRYDGTIHIISVAVLVVVVDIG